MSYIFHFRVRLNLALPFFIVLVLCFALFVANKGAVHATGLTSTGGKLANWVQFGYNAQHTGYNPKETILTPTNVSKLKLDWQSPKTGDVYSSLAVFNGAAYFGSVNHKFYALNASTGTLLWGYTTRGAIYSSPAVSNGIVYVGSDDHNLYALNDKTGKLIWKYTTGGAVDSSPALVNGNVYIGSADKKVYALNASTGTFLWSYTTGGIINAAPAVANGVVYVGSQNAKLYALNATTGAFKWSYSILTQFNIINSAPVVAGGIVYVGSFDTQGQNTKLYAVNASTGAFIWSYDVTGCGIDSSPTVANGIVYIGSDGSGGYQDGCFASANLFALNAKTGAFLWSNYIGGPDSANNSSPTIANGVLYVGSNTFDHTSNGGYAVWYAINTQSGTVKWTHFDNTNGNGPTNYPNPAPVVVNGVYYISSGAYHGFMHAFHVPGTN